jgi:uncharacterized protein (DUF1499 family)
MFFYFLLAIAVLVVGAAIYIRTVPIDAARWHVDPEAVTPPASPNFALLAASTAPQIDAAPLVVAGRIEAVAEAEGASVVAGAAAEGFVTYMVRSRLMGFPDFISIKLVPHEEGTRLNIFSRSRDGFSDLGVNTARVQRWLTAARGE